MARNTAPHRLDTMGLGHAFITLASHHMFFALALACLLVAGLRYRPISMALASLAVLGCDGVTIETLSTGVTGPAPVSVATAQALPRDWIAAPGHGQV